MPDLLPVPSSICRIELPDELVASIEHRARATGRTFDSLVAELLSLGQTYSLAAYPIDRTSDLELRALVGGRIDSAPKLVDMVKRLVTLRVGGLRVELRPAVMEQIFWACKSLGRTVEEHGPELIESAISEHFRT